MNLTFVFLANYFSSIQYLLTWLATPNYSHSSLSVMSYQCLTKLHLKVNGLEVVGSGLGQ